MAELDTSSSGGKKGGGKVRTKKQSTRVDLTAMVDLAFLLITFFILTTTLSKPKSMELIMPDKTDQTKQLPVPESRTMTLLLGKNDMFEWFVGAAGATPPEKSGYTGNKLRKILIEQNKKIMESHGGQPMIVIVSPSAKATYKNVVTVMDELNIVDIQQRAIVTINQTDIGLLQRDGLL